MKIIVIVTIIIIIIIIIHVNTETSGWQPKGIETDIPDPRISKVAEEFVVDGFVKPAVMNILDDNQYGAIPNSSTTMALISKPHNWSLGTDGNGATVRTLLLDYRKAFDLIDHSILVRRLRNQCKLPASIITWIIDSFIGQIPADLICIRMFFWLGPSPCWRTTGDQTKPMVVRSND